MSVIGPSRGEGLSAGSRTRRIASGSRHRLPPLRISGGFTRDPGSWTIFALIVAFGVGLPLLIAVITGNIAIPHNDAWAYSRITRTFWSTGQFRLLNWDDMMLIGQVVMLGPLGKSIVLQQVAVSVLAVVCLWCIYDLVSIRLPARRALLATLIIVIWPGFASLATSFMTDIPALTGTLLTLCVGRRALARESRILFVLALLIAFWAGSVGVQTLAAPVALFLCAAFTFPRRTKIRLPMLIVTAVAFAVPFLILMHWRDGLPAGDNFQYTLHLSTIETALKTNYPQIYFTLGAVLAPVAILAARPWRWRWPSWVLVLIVAGYAVRLLVIHIPFYVGSYFVSFGEYYQVTPQSHPSIPNWLWQAYDPLAIAGGLFLAGSLAERWRRVDPMLGLYTLITLIGLLAVPATGHLFFDRYLLPIAPGVLAIVLAPSGTTHGVRVRGGAATRLRAVKPHARRALIAVGVVAFAVLVTMSALNLTNQMSFDAARWHTASAVVADGVPANRVAAGLEWDGTHSGNGVAVGPRFNGIGPAWNWQLMFYDQPACVALFAGPVGPSSYLKQIHWTYLRSYTYHTWLILGTAHLYAYDTHGRGCARATSV